LPPALGSRWFIHPVVAHECPRSHTLAANSGGERLLPAKSRRFAEFCRAEKHVAIADRKGRFDLRRTVRARLREQAQRTARQPGICGTHLPALNERHQDLVIPADSAGERSTRLQLLI